MTCLAEFWHRVPTEGLEPPLSQGHPTKGLLWAAGAAQGQPLSVYTSSPGPVFDATLRYEALLRTIPSTFTGDYYLSWQGPEPQTSSSQVTRAPLSGRRICLSWSPISGIVLIATLATDANWRKLTTYVDEAGFKTIVFTRFVPAGVVRLSFGAGFGLQEGPLGTCVYPRFTG